MFEAYVRKSKDDFFDNIPISKNDLNDIFIDFLDLDYEVKIKQFYLTKTGHTFVSKKGVSGYPVISISIKKEISEKSGNVSNWDGSIYYEEKQDVITNLNDSVSMLRSMIGDSAKVLVAFRGVGEIYIRIVQDFVKTDGISLHGIDSIIKETVESFTVTGDDKSRLINHYQAILTGFTNPDISRSSRDFEIVPLYTTLLRRSSYKRPVELSEGDYIVNNFLGNNHTDNKRHLMSVFDIIIETMKSNLKKKYPEVKIRHVVSHQHYVEYEIYTENVPKNNKIATIKYSYEPIDEGYVAKGKKKLFKSRDVKKVDIYKAEVDIKYKLD